MQKSKIKNQNYISKFKISNFGLSFCILIFGFWISLVFAQSPDDLEFTLDVSAEAIPLPKIFQPNIDLSGRGFHRDLSQPQTLADKEVLNTWQKDIGFRGFYRLQYNLWEIYQLSKDKDAQDNLLANYDALLKNITDAGGVALLDIFGTPPGLGRALDKKVPPLDFKAFKELVKGVIYDLSCKKRYNIWYEVWNAPDLDEFFLGRRIEYLNLYRAVAQAIKELEAETKIHIPVGGPSTSWWFQAPDGNTMASPERSLVYELIKYCRRYHLPIDFISWHGFSTDPKAEKENTIYKNKTTVKLIRDWLGYFNFNRNTPLIIDEWNYDRNANVLAERKEKSFICASFIPARIKNMYEAGIDYQFYFSLEDFQDNKEGVVRNTGLFWFDPRASGYKGGPKATYNVLKMLARLGNEMFSVKLEDEFIGVIATRARGEVIILIFNYIDPEIVNSYLSKNIAGLNGRERKILLKLIKSDKLTKIMSRTVAINTLRLTKRIKALLKKAQELNDQAQKFAALERKLKINLKNMKENYLYQSYAIDSSCSLDCEFALQEEKEVNITDTYTEEITLKPYSAQLVILKKKPMEQNAGASIEKKE